MIKKAPLYAAYKDLNATALVLYLYLAGNKDGFTLALSPQAIHAETGMPLSTCKDQIKKLIQKGYLVPRGENSNQYDFYETPLNARGSTDDVQNNGSRSPATADSQKKPGAI